MIQVVADTNALLLPFQTRINIDIELQRLVGDHELVIPKAIIGELRKLASENREAKAALGYALTKQSMDTIKHGDEAVLELAIQLKTIIISNDKELILKARKLNIRIIRLRGHHLAFDLA